MLAGFASTLQRLNIYSHGQTSLKTLTPIHFKAMADDMPPKIDVHVHFLPPAYRQACIENGFEYPDGVPLPEWNEGDHVQLMDAAGIEKAILSISSPGTNLVYDNKQLAAQVTRDCNAYAADLKRRMPDRFGYWASLPIPNVDQCLQEIDTAANEGCDGFVLLTNGWGHYLGDAILDPIFKRLNELKTTVFVHPTAPCIKCELAPSKEPTHATPLEDRYPAPMLEFFFDTARVVANLFLSGTVSRCPDLKIILPHLGGASPPPLSRWTAFSTLTDGPWEPVDETTARAAFNRQFWFDLAGVPFPGQIIGLLKGVGVGHKRLLYGSDFPFTNANLVNLLLDQMDTGMKGMFGEGEIEDIYYKNAQKLLDGDGGVRSKL